MKNIRKIVIGASFVSLLCMPKIAECAENVSELAQNPLVKYLLIGVGISFIMLVLFLSYKLDSASPNEKSEKPISNGKKIKFGKSVANDFGDTENEFEDNVDYTADINKFDEYSEDFEGEVEEESKLFVPETPDTFIRELRNYMNNQHAEDNSVENDFVVNSNGYENFNYEGALEDITDYEDEVEENTTDSEENSYDINEVSEEKELYDNSIDDDLKAEVKFQLPEIPEESTYTFSTSDVSEDETADEIFENAEMPKESVSNSNEEFSFLSQLEKNMAKVEKKNEEKVQKKQTRAKNSTKKATAESDKSAKKTITKKTTTAKKTTTKKTATKKSTEK